MPNRFPSFTPEQADQLAHEFNYRWKRLALWVTILTLGVAVGFGFGLYKIQQASDRGDTASKLAIQVNRQLIADANQRAADSRQAAAKAAKTAYATCRQQQESRPITRDFFHLVRDLSVTPQQRREFNHLHDELVAQRAFHVPKCVKPPKGA